ncbi:transposase for IS1668, partial [Photorhabdus temperata subsp. temperata M1021]
MHRTNKPRGFFYLDHRTVDGQVGIITDTYATPGNVHDSQPFIKRLTRQLERFALNPLAVGLDAGYFTAPVCYLTEQLGVMPIIGYRRPNKGSNVFQKKHFTYDKQEDCYVCPQGEKLIYKTTSREGYRHYQAAATICQYCPKRASCTQAKGGKKITRHVWEDSKEQARENRLTEWGKKTYKRRKETIERSFADAKQHHGHR